MSETVDLIPRRLPQNLVTEELRTAVRRELELDRARRLPRPLPPEVYNVLIR